MRKGLSHTRQDWDVDGGRRDGVSREVPCSALKGEMVPESLPATPKSPPTRRAQRPRSLLEALLLWVPMAQGLQGQDKGNFPRTRFARTQPAMETPFPGLDSICRVPEAVLSPRFSYSCLQLWF